MGKTDTSPGQMVVTAVTEEEGASRAQGKETFRQQQLPTFKQEAFYQLIEFMP